MNNRKWINWLSILISVLVIMVLSTIIMDSSEKDSKAAVEKAYPTVSLNDSLNVWFHKSLDSGWAAFHRKDTLEAVRLCGKVEAYMNVINVKFKQDSISLMKTLNQ
jgi:hypothetical protein